MKKVSQVKERFVIEMPIKHSHLNYPRNSQMSSFGDFQTEIGELWTSNGADKIFRTKEDFTSWLNAPNPALAGAAPIQFIKSDIRKIADLLGRILYGVLA
jgi:hypothetical protein